ncbi:unnamed protein product, partial [Prunus brigantina]
LDSGEAGAADFGSCFLSAPTPDSGKTSAKRTTKLPSSSPSPSPPRSAAIVPGIRPEIGCAGQFLTELPTFRSPSSGHQIGRVSTVPATFWGMSKNKSCSKWGVLPKLGVWAGGSEFFRSPEIDQATHALPVRGQIGGDHIQF